jgi:DUF4097 and DUF4098 domain-containing protein YvlB
MPFLNEENHARRRFPTSSAVFMMVASLLGTTAHAQQSAQAWVEQCRSSNGGRATHCEVRESTLPVSASLSVNAQPNGGIHVQSWDRNEILVQAKVRASAPSEPEARALASEVHVNVGAGRVDSDGPRATGSNRSWSVSYDVFVPRSIDLTLTSTNGGVRVEGVEGQLRLNTTNGGISIAGAAGDVRGQTTNGGIDVRLQGNSWRGSGLDLRTTNGSVVVHAPATFSARLNAQTTNGGITTDFPMTVQGRLGRTVEGDIGQGGAPLRITTTNGTIRLVRN